MKNSNKVDAVVKIICVGFVVMWIMLVLIDMFVNGSKM